MNHIKTFEQYNINNESTLNEGLFSSDIKNKIKKILDLYENDQHISDEVINSLLLEVFRITFNSEATKVLKNKVLALPTEEKISLLKEVYAKLTYSSIDSIRLLIQPSGKLFVGSIKRPPINLNH